MPYSRISRKRQRRRRALAAATVMAVLVTAGVIAGSDFIAPADGVTPRDTSTVAPPEPRAAAAVQPESAEAAPLDLPPPPGDTPPPVQVLAGHSAAVNTVVFSPDGRLIASGGDDRKLILWDRGQGREWQTLPPAVNRVAALAFSPDGNFLAWSTGTAFAPGEAAPVIWLWDIAAGRLARPLVETPTGHQSVYSPRTLAFSPDGNILAAGGDDRVIRLWNLADGTLRSTFTGHPNATMSLAFAPDGAFLASGGGDGTVKLWNVADGALTATVPASSRWIRSVVFAPDGKMLASAEEDRTIKLWDAASGRLLRSLADQRWPRSLAFAPDGRFLVSGGQDGLVKLWNPATGELQRQVSGHSEAILCLAYAPDGNSIVSASLDNTIRLWNFERPSQANGSSR
jgi:WD40 repeat protein